MAAPMFDVHLTPEDRCVSRSQREGATAPTAGFHGFVKEDRDPFAFGPPHHPAPGLRRRV